VVHNAGISPEFFDFIIVDECHRYDSMSRSIGAKL